MRRLLAIFLAFTLCIGCTGCKSKPNPKEMQKIDLQKGFSATANISYGSLQAVAEINRSGVGLCTIELTSPSHLKGLKFELADGRTTVSYRGLKVDLTEEGMLASAVTSAISNALDTAAQGTGITFTKRSEGIVIAGKNDLGAFELTFDPKAGTLVRLSIPTVELDCSFGDYKQSGDLEQK